MKTYKLSSFNNIYLNSFHPLCTTEMGQLAIKKYGHPKYIDASCRREPDLENPYPTISAICRQGLFAPRLRVDDVVVYMSVKKSYYDDQEGGNKLIAFLKVVEVFKSHQEGYDWYNRKGLDIPSNCIVDANPPYGFDHTAGNFDTVRQMRTYLNRDPEQRSVIGKRLLDHWDRSYKEKVQVWKMLVRTEPIHIEYDDPVTLYKRDLESIFGTMNTNTRNPKAITLQHLKKLGLMAGVDIQTD